MIDLILKCVAIGGAVDLLFVIFSSFFKNVKLIEYCLYSKVDYEGEEHELKFTKDQSRYFKAIYFLKRKQGTSLFYAKVFFVNLFYEGILMGSLRGWFNLSLPVRKALERHIFCQGGAGFNRSNSKAGTSDSEIVSFKHVGDLIKLDEEIERYFRALYLVVGARDECIKSVLKVNISDGYVAPLFLLSGLLAKLEEDWTVVGDEPKDWHKFANKHMENLDGSVIGLQSFLLDCWLLWGPSICLPDFSKDTCDRWEGKLIPVQYGLGDENNSLNLVMKKSIIESLFARLRTKSPEIQYPSAFRSRVMSGHLWFHHCKFKIDNDEGFIIPDLNVTSQFGKAVLSAGNPDWDRAYSLVVESDSQVPGENLSGHKSRYYSAYLWISFVLTDPNTGEPYVSSKSIKPAYHAKDAPYGPWRNVLPFFEHANIVDAESYQFLEKHLALKTASSLWDLATKQAETALVRSENHLVVDKNKYDQKQLLFTYCGAIDDLCCETCTTPGNASQTLWGKVDEHLERLKQYFANTMLKNLYPHFSEQDRIDYSNFVRSHIIMPSDASHPQHKSESESNNSGNSIRAKLSTTVKDFNGCHLFEQVARYYEHLSEREKLSNKS